MTSYGRAAPRAEPFPAGGLRALLAAVLAVGVEHEGDPARAVGRHAAERMLLDPVPVRPDEPHRGDGEGWGDEGRDEEVWALVEAAQAGDAEAFGQLYDRYVDTVHRYAYARLGDRTLAEDVTSETFLRALRRIGTVSYRGRDVGAWFVTIARNLVLDHLKSGRNRYEVTTGDLPDTHRLADGPEPAVLDRLTSEELLRCVRQLPPDQQECLVLRFLQELSVSETAAVMRRNAGAVKALQHRAVRRLATLLPEGVR
ncbi:MAG TPA: sigma-70 family RNA polymerase sigma factor [Mycobacteriales bacterium]|nr:sigma-70 family RNA polymerase sigma factor [Mycobacteriales bacterium]